MKALWNSPESTGTPGTSRPVSRVRLPYLTALPVAAVLALSACGGGDASDPEDSPVVEADEELAAMVPADLAEEGVITIGVDSEYPPAEFLDTDGQTVIGFDVELFDAAAAKLGLETDWQSAPFDAIITGVDSGKYDVGVSSFTINNERLENVNMVSYLTAGTQWFGLAGNPNDVDPDNACGRRIAVQAGTVQVPDIEARSEQCEEDGEAPIEIQQFESQTQATTSVVSGQSDASLADLPVSGYAIEQTGGGKLETYGDQYEAAPYGVVTPKEDTELAEAIAAGYAAIIEDGTYGEILAEWGIGNGAIETPEVNPSVEQ
ncbi:amino acid ABC transporter substrate-binding protein (PAAT family) [Actinorugispora endophytica]|uniref:Amino acid ABC transporter substrate-binding protein (PAAT family) n=1 Tax=Actinorugispora endophytica TaxID=1605990 RepID=A0A4R6V5B2_9ACTN|nr:amino acid ABC transporter substrate-binding protein (PAAT family) [Actinorugispora endophytica]